jgi:hypothetical protein
MHMHTSGCSAVEASTYTQAYAQHCMAGRQVYDAYLLLLRKQPDCCLPFAQNPAMRDPLPLLLSPACAAHSTHASSSLITPPMQLS